MEDSKLQKIIIALLALLILAVLSVGYAVYRQPRTAEELRQEQQLKGDKVMKAAQDFIKNEATRAETEEVFRGLGVPEDLIKRQLDQLERVRSARRGRR